MIDERSIFIIIHYKGGYAGSWIEILPETYREIQLKLVRCDDLKFISIQDRNDDYPALINVSEIEFIEVDVPNEDDIKNMEVELNGG